MHLKETIFKMHSFNGWNSSTPTKY